MYIYIYSAKKLPAALMPKPCITELVNGEQLVHQELGPDPEAVHPYLSFDLSAHLSIHLSIYLYALLSVYQSVYRSVYPFICPSIYLTIYLYLSMSIYPSI